MKLCFILCVFFSSLYSVNSPAKRYKVEALIFANQASYTTHEPSQSQKIHLPEKKQSVWRLPTSLLRDPAFRLKKSENYHILKHISWGQNALSKQHAAMYVFNEEDLHGWIKVYASHLLFVDVNLEIQGYRIKERRRLLLNEKHLFDHPKFGVLLQVSRLLVAKKKNAKSKSKK